MATRLDSTRLDADKTVQDDAPAFATGKLTATLTVNGLASDVLGFKPSLPGQPAVTTSGTSVLVDNVIVGTYTGGTNGTALVFTLNTNANVLKTQAVIRAIAYSSVSEDPGSNPRTVQLVLTDTAGAASIAVKKTITVVPVNDAPVLSNASTVAYTTGSAGVKINIGIQVGDIDNQKLASATVRIANFAAGQDVLVLTTTLSMGNITATFDNVLGVLTLTSSGATATTAQFQIALRAVSYKNLSSAPDKTVRTIEFRVSDGSLQSNPISSTVSIT